MLAVGIQRCTCSDEAQGNERIGGIVQKAQEESELFWCPTCTFRAPLVTSQMPCDMSVIFRDHVIIMVAWRGSFKGLQYES